MFAAAALAIFLLASDLFSAGQLQGVSSFTTGRAWALRCALPCASEWPFRECPWLRDLLAVQVAAAESCWRCWAELVFL